MRGVLILWGVLVAKIRTLTLLGKFVLYWKEKKHASVNPYK